MLEKFRQQDKRLLQAFSNYQKRTAKLTKKRSWNKFLHEIVYRTMRLEGERITRKETKALFR